MKEESMKTARMLTNVYIWGKNKKKVVLSNVSQ